MAHAAHQKNKYQMETEEAEVVDLLAAATNTDTDANASVNKTMKEGTDVAIRARQNEFWLCSLKEDNTGTFSSQLSQCFLNFFLMVKVFG